MEKTEIKLDAFMCLDWDLYYDLGNPENFSNPDSTIEWEDNSIVYDYFEKPYTDNTTVKVSSAQDSSEILKDLEGNKDTIEKGILDLLQDYTFGGNWAYAAAKHFEWAKTEIERRHNTTYSYHEFLKRNLCLLYIDVIDNEKWIVDFDFTCSWDCEHGIKVRVVNAKEFRIIS